jgi:hypothetical protein
MPMYMGFDHETIVIISEALSFVSRKMREFYDAKKPAVDTSHHALIDAEYQKKIELLDGVRGFLTKADNLALFTSDERTFAADMNLIRSALEVFLEDMLAARVKTGLSTFDAKIAQIRQAMDLGALKSSNTTLFDEYYQAPVAGPQGGKVEIFFSYAHEDKVLAGKIASLLKNKGIDVFLAHEDIKVSEEWRNEIIKHLKTDRILIALLTPNYGKSVWANQEAGFMMGKGGQNISLIVDGSNIKDFGFLESFQGVPITEAAVAECIDKIIEASLKVISVQT